MVLRCAALCCIGVLHCVLRCSELTCVPRCSALHCVLIVLHSGVGSMYSQAHTSLLYIGECGSLWSRELKRQTWEAGSLSFSFGSEILALIVQPPAESCQSLALSLKWAEERGNGPSLGSTVERDNSQSKGENKGGFFLFTPTFLWQLLFSNRYQREEAERIWKYIKEHKRQEKWKIYIAKTPDWSLP